MILIYSKTNERLLNIDSKVDNINVTAGNYMLWCEWLITLGTRGTTTIYGVVSNGVLCLLSVGHFMGKTILCGCFPI